MLIDFTEAQHVNADDIGQTQASTLNYINEIFSAIPPQYSEYASNMILQEMKNLTEEQVPKYILNILLKYFVDFVVNEMYVNF